MATPAPALNTRPGRVLETEIHRRFGCPVNHDPSSPDKEFFLVVSVGRWKFRLSESSVACLLHAVLGSFPEAFHVVQLDDRVFRFSVATSSVGFHIYNLRSFECLDFKIFFHLWHGGGPNFVAEYRNWLREQEAEWVHVGDSKGHQQMVRLTGANSIPVSASHRQPLSSNSMEFSNLNPAFNPKHNSVFNHIKKD